MAQVYRTDGELLRAFAGDNEDAAFEELVRRHGGLVWRVERRVCRRDDDAEDVVQQVFLTLAKRSAELGGRVSLAGWIYNTTLHVSMRQRRNAALREKHEREAGAQKGRAAAGTNAAAADWADPGQGGVGLLGEGESEQGDRLRRALAALPETYRDALILHHIEGYTVEETAALLAANAGTVAARLSRGRAILRERLGAMGVGAGVGVGMMIDAEMAWAAEEGPLELAAETCARLARDMVAASPQSVSGVVAGGTTFVAVKKLNLAAACVALVWATVATAGGVAFHRYAFDAEPEKKQADRLRQTDTAELNERVSGAGGAVSVPEPGAVSLIGVAAVALLRRPK